jgi:hypothetical protein
LTRYRKRLVQGRAQEALRVQKLLEDAGVKLASVATDILGKSGRAMLDALVAGERDPKVLAEMALGRMRVKVPALREALATARFPRPSRLDAGRAPGPHRRPRCSRRARQRRSRSVDGPFC